MLLNQSDEEQSTRDTIHFRLERKGTSTLVPLYQLLLRSEFDIHWVLHASARFSYA